MTWSVIESGGPILYLLIFMNVFGVAIMLYKWKEFRDANKEENQVQKEIVDKINQKFASGTNEETQLFLLEIIREEVGQYIHNLDKRLPTLKTIANVAPLLGLLGTVWGILLAFNVMATHGTGDPGLFANGISKALITTIAGLIVAIIHLLAFHYFSGRLQTKEMCLEKKIMTQLLS